jgi:hypothetical protein
MVKVRIAISKLLAALAVFGLLLTPLARPSIAMATDGSPMSEQMAVEMPADMPCCPDQAPAKDCMKDCPFMLMCAGHYVPNRAGASGLLIPLLVSSLILPGNETEASSLTHRPPPRPPKFLA